MPAVTVDGAVVEEAGHVIYLGIHVDKMLTYRKHVETPTLKWEKCLSVLKGTGMEQRPLPAVSRFGAQCH